MKRILFFVLWIIPVFQPSAGAVEIYVNGHKYDSLQAYQAFKKNSVLPISSVNHNHLSDATQHKLYVLSVENGVLGALRDFYNTWGQSDLQLSRSITSGQLQEAIQQAVTTSQGPKLLISQPGKVRILSISSDNSQKQK